MENAIHTLLIIGGCPLETAPEDVQAEVEALRAAIALMRGQSEARDVLIECRPFVAYAFDQGLLGAGEAGAKLDAVLAAMEGK